MSVCLSYIVLFYYCYYYTLDGVVVFVGTVVLVVGSAAETVSLKPMRYSMIWNAA